MALKAILVFVVLAVSSHSKDDIDSSAPSKKPYSYSILPILFYEPATKLGGGVNAGYYRRLLKSPKPSSLVAEISYTQMRQISVELRPELYLDTIKQYYAGNIFYKDYPTLFWGVGNATSNGDEEQFTERFFSLRLLGQYIATHAFRLGPQIAYRSERIDGYLAGGLLASVNSGGVAPWSALGLGPLLSYDTRKDVYLGLEGSLLEVGALVYPGGIFSTSAFGRVSIDARSFRTVAQGHVIGIQAYADLGWSDLPVQIMPAIGRVLRGYHENRFVDKRVIACQVEYRYPIWRKFSGVVFAGAGDVFDRLDDLSFSRVKLCAGPGLRFRLNNEGVNIRADYGFSRFYGGALYISAREAF